MHGFFELLIDFIINIFVQQIRALYGIGRYFVWSVVFIFDISHFIQLSNIEYK